MQQPQYVTTLDILKPNTCLDKINPPPEKNWNKTFFFLATGINVKWNVKTGVTRVKNLEASNQRQGTFWPLRSQQLHISLRSHCPVCLSSVRVSAAASNDAVSTPHSGGEYHCPGLTVTPLCDTSSSHGLHDSRVLIRVQVHLDFRQTALLMTSWNGPGRLSMTERSPQTPGSLFHRDTERHSADACDNAVWFHAWQKKQRNFLAKTKRPFFFINVLSPFTGTTTKRQCVFSALN